MKRCALFCAAWWPFLLFPLLLLLLFGLFKWQAIENDVASNAQQNLATAQLDWAEAETYHRGRDVLITGVAPDEQAVTQAIQAALAAEGVRTTRFVGNIAKQPLKPAVLSAHWRGENIILSGEVNSQANMDSIVTKANSVFGANRVTSQLRLSDQRTNLSLPSSLFSALVEFDDGDSISILGNELTLRGEVTTEDIKAQVEDAFPGTVNNLLTVSEPPGFRNRQCQAQLNNLLTEAKINFQSGKAVIKEDSDELLAEIAKIAESCPDALFEVAGHTDSVGALTLNMTLSERRAQAVVNKLAAMGLDAKRFTVEGYGPNQPIASNQTRDGRAKNRRIEFKIKN